MKIIVLGCGNVGSVVARDMAEGIPSVDIVIADNSVFSRFYANSIIQSDPVNTVSCDAVVVACIILPKIYPIITVSDYISGYIRIVRLIR